MKRKNILTISIISIVLVIVCTLASTYAVIINVVNNNGVSEIVNQISVRDILTNEDGSYNEEYYNIKRELDITLEEANILMDSDSINSGLQTVLKSIVDYKLKNIVSAKLSNEELIELITDATYKDNSIDDELKEKIVNKTNIYIQDISDYIYDLEVSYLGEI